MAEPDVTSNDSAAAAHSVFRSRLFRRYLWLILALVCGALLASSGTGLYFSYKEIEAENAVRGSRRIGTVNVRFGHDLWSPV